MGHSVRWQACIEAAEANIEQCKARGELVLVDRLVAEILRKHPECGLSEREMGAIVSTLVIEKRWSLAP